MGQYCETDRNECKEEKPCDQMCYNTEGSYYCMCRDGFQLQTDKQSCRKIIGFGGDNAFEARDMENDVDYEEINVKISNIEKVSLKMKNIIYLYRECYQLFFIISPVGYW